MCLGFFLCFHFFRYIQTVRHTPKTDSVVYFPEESLIVINKELRVSIEAKHTLKAHTGKKKLGMLSLQSKPWFSSSP